MTREVLCHIGLPKSGSTVLQNTWSAATNYAINSPLNLIQIIQRAVLEESVCERALIKIISEHAIRKSDLDGKSNQYVVISSESFTQPPIAGSQRRLRIEKLFLNCVASIVEGCTDKVLLVVRNPLTWIKSYYYQQIKEGRSYSFPEYLVEERRSIVANLDLGAILAAFQSRMPDVVLLPIELLQANEERFWQEYEERLKFPRPNINSLPSDTISANKTREETISLHRTLNQCFEMLENAVAALEMTDKEPVLDALSMAKKWGTRRALGFMNESDLRRLQSLMNQPGQLPAPQCFSLEKELIEDLTENFLASLEEPGMFPYPEYLEEYRASLKSGAIQIF